MNAWCTRNDSLHSNAPKHRWCAHAHEATVWYIDARSHTIAVIKPSSVERARLNQRKEKDFFKVLNSAHNTISSGANVAVKGCILYFTLGIYSTSKYTSIRLSWTTFQYSIYRHIVERERVNTDQKKIIIIKRREEETRQRISKSRVYMCVKIIQKKIYNHI